MEYAQFSSLAEAIKHRDQHGGWLFLVDEGPVFWFAPKFTPTQICQHRATRAYSGKLI